ncbi:MAG: TetR/AcrR family transcriptional regulator [Lachnospiraceae bacterium]|nr:TetR/AcrR family transcriptional regulator [Lachnospiraceae bacterium]
MNSKFFDVKKDKQDKIINAALHTFTIKGYKDASTDVIVKEAGISKGLLFHYFVSKQGLYDFICDYSTKYMILELTRAVKKSEKDCFELMSQISLARVRVMKNYPYMPAFLRSITRETDPDAIKAIGENISDMTKTYRNIYDKIDSRTLVKPDRLPQVIKIIDWVCQGYLEENFIEKVPDPDRLYEEYSGYLTLLRDHFYTREVDGTVSFAKEELNERNETVMKEMRMDMTFEERLMAGRQPLVESEEEDDKSEEDNAEKSEQAATEPSTETVRETGQPETFDDIIREAEKNIQSAGAGSGE